MAFTSFHFLVFFLVIFALNRALLGHLESRKSLLLVASYYFYMCWDWRFASLIALMTFVNYCSAQQIEKTVNQVKRKFWVSYAVVVSVGVLIFFKAADFFVAGAIELLRQSGFPADPIHLGIILPLGLSFFTFQGLSYTIDVYRRKQQTCHSPLDFALFVAFFPTLLSGPITRADQLLPQFKAPLDDSGQRLEEGFNLVVIGYIKKVIIADLLATHWVVPAFSNPQDFSSAYLLCAVYAYSFQIYADLSGYTDIARGSAKLLGFELPRNFNRPYHAKSVSEFWQRWHISMSSFFRDYLYFSLGGSRHGNVNINLLITFVAIGLWHGVGWGFIVYGLIHGSALCLERRQRALRQNNGLPPLPESGIFAWWRILITFQIIAFSRVFFRAGDLNDALSYFTRLANFSLDTAAISLYGVIVLTVAAATYYLPSKWSVETWARFSRLPAFVQGAFLVVLALTLVAFSHGEVPFVYFQF